MNFSPKFKYVKPPKSPLLILNKKNKTNENIKEDLPWGKRINLRTLKEKWTNKLKIDFRKDEKVFPEIAVTKKAIKAKEEVKQMLDKDILKLKKEKWDDSVNINSNKFLYKDYIYMNESIFDSFGFNHPSLKKNEMKKAQYAYIINYHI